MKIKTSNNLIKTLLILLVAVLFGCQEDELNQADHQEHTEASYQRKNISYNEYLNAISNLKGSENALGITSNRNPTDFIIGIDTNNIIEYTDGDTTTYTMRAYTQDENSNYFTNGLVRVKNGELTRFILRYIPSSAYKIKKALTIGEHLTYDGLLQLLTLEGVIVTEQELIDGISQRIATGCEPHIIGEGGYWRCSAGSKHSPEPCPPTCTRCDDDFTWVPFQISIISGCGGSGNNNNNNDTNNDNPFGDIGTGNGSNDTNNDNNNSNTNNAPDLPTEPVFGGGEDIPIEEYFNDYLCSNNPMDYDDINWAYDNHDEATEIWNYVYNHFTPNNESDCVEIDFEDKLVIDSTFKNNQKAKCVYDRMKNLNGSVFSELLSSFDNSTNARLTFKVNNIPQTNPNIYYNAKTLPRFGGGLRTFDIVLDEQFVQNASLIEIALTLFHELIHAELFERCIQLGIISGTTINSDYEVGVIFASGEVGNTNLPDLLFSLLVDNYTNFSDPNNESNPLWQHELFSVLNYRDQISNILEQVHPLLNDSNNPFETNLNNNVTIPMTMEEYFELMSWLGLEGTMEYNNLTPLEITKLNQAYNQTNIYYNENCI